MWRPFWRSGRHREAILESQESLPEVWDGSGSPAKVLDGLE